MTERPVLLLVSSFHRAVVEPEFRSRYDRDYAIEVVGTAARALSRAQELCDADIPIAMIAADYQLPDTTAIELLGRIHEICATARRVVLLSRQDYAGAIDSVREANLARGFDTYLGIPTGPRDEEFHTAIIELLSEWGWSVASPVVSMADVVTDKPTANTAAIRDLLERLGVPNRLLYLDDDDARPILDEAGPDAILPVVRAVSGQVLDDATPARIAESMYGGFDRIPPNTIADVLVIGAGPAGLAAAVYAASEGLSTIVLESEAIGGQAGSSSMIRNYLGFPRGVSGMRLTQRSRFQAVRFGARFFTGRAAIAVEKAPENEPTHHHVHVDGATLCARTVVVATGVAYRRLGVPALEELTGLGVYYGAATSMAREMAGANVFVVGGGNSAGQAAVHMAKFANSVSIIVRRDSLAETMSEYLIREIEATGNIRVKTNTRVVDGGGDGMLEWLDLESSGSPESLGASGSLGDLGLRERVAAHGLFCLLGAEPSCDWLPALVARDEHGFVLTGRDVPRELWIDGCPPAGLETSVPGIFAVGDVRFGSMKRVASAAGEGASVMPLVHAHLAYLRKLEFEDA